MHRSVYRWAARAVHRLPLGRGKLGRSIAGRRQALERWTAWAADHRATGPLIWMHAASVGEALTAQPVVARLRSSLRNAQVIHTYTSPAVAGWPAPFEAEASDYAPLDEPASVGRVLDAVQPSLLAFSRGDLWPELVSAAATRDVPVVVLGATVRAGSRRRHPFLRPLYAAVHEAVSWLGAATQADATRWIELGVQEAAVHLTGDPRHDQVLERVTRLERLEGLIAWATGSSTLVAGSVEPSDVGVLLQAARAVLDRERRARLLWVPHAPTRRSVARLLARMGRRGIASTAWPDQDPLPEHRVVVATVPGVLFDLYALGQAAYVGGGLRSGGLHAVGEPAAYALPVIVGPQWDSCADAAAMVASGGAVALPRRGAAASLAQTWRRWLGDDGARLRTGLAARHSLHEGAAAHTARALLGLLGEAGREAPREMIEPGRVPCGPHLPPPSQPPTAVRR